MTSIIEFNDKDKLDIEFIGNLLRKNKFLVSKKISTEVSFTADKTIYLTQKKTELARITFYKSKSGFIKKFYDLEILFGLSGSDSLDLFKFYEKKRIENYLRCMAKIITNMNLLSLKIYHSKQWIFYPLILLNLSKMFLIKKV